MLGNFVAMGVQGVSTAVENRYARLLQASVDKEMDVVSVDQWWFVVESGGRSS